MERPSGSRIDDWLARALRDGRLEGSAAWVRTRSWIAGLLLAVGCGGEEAAEESSPGPSTVPNAPESTGAGGAGGTALMDSPVDANGGTGGSSTGPGVGGDSSGGAAGSGEVLRGAVSLEVLESSECVMAAGFIDLPEVSGGHPVDAAEKSAALENGGVTADGNRVNIACMWADFGDQLFVDAVINVQIQASRATVNLGSTDLRVGEPAAGGLFVSGPLLPNQYSAPPTSCTLTAIEIDRDARSVWGRIECPFFESSENDEGCEVRGFFSFENCPDAL